MTLEYSIYPLQKIPGAKMVPLVKGGSLVDQIQLPKDTLVERGGIRVIEGQGKRLAPGSYQAVAVVDYGGSSLVAGQTAFVVH